MFYICAALQPPGLTKLLSTGWFLMATWSHSFGQLLGVSWEELSLGSFSAVVTFILRGMQFKKCRTLNIKAVAISSWMWNEIAQWEWLCVKTDSVFFPRLWGQAGLSAPFWSWWSWSELLVQQDSVRPGRELWEYLKKFVEKVQSRCMTCCKNVEIYAYEGILKNLIENMWYAKTCISKFYLFIW